MNESADQLAKSLLQKNSVADCDLHELQQLAERYPYSAIHQALLLHKLKNENVSGYTEQLDKTGLYFQHPLWLDQLLQGKGDAVVVEKQKVTEPVLSAPAVSEEQEEETSMADIPTLNMDWASETEEAKEETITQVQEEEQPLAGTPDPVVPEQIEKEVIAENLQKNLLTDTIEEEETVHVHAPDPVVPEQTQEEEPEEETVSNMDNAMSYAEKADEEVVEVEIIEVVAEEEEPYTPPPPGWKDDMKEEAVAGNAEPEHIFSAVMETPQTEEPVVSNSNTMTEENIRETEPVQHEPVQAEETEMKIPSFTIEPIDPATAELNFQPYHTVDYFASQGIKFKEEEKPKDRFGQQLKSFTEWLKVLKKTPAAEVAGNISKNSELKVEQMAEHSIEGGEVLTETMAEVWEKQGNRQKASEIYRKLSLLNPSKISYFAAKIEQLKNN